MQVLDLNTPEVEAGVKRLNGAKVRLPDVPTEIELHFGLHAYAGHLDSNFGEALNEADIFSLEQVGWAPDTKELTQRLADGDEEARDTLERSVHGYQDAFWQEMHQAMFNTHVMVHNPDVPKGHALALQHERVTNEAALLAVSLLHDLIDEADLLTPMLEELTQQLFSVYGKREKYILQHFFPREIPDVESLKVVGFFGILHRNLAVALGRQVVREGRDDITISMTEMSGPPSGAYENFLHQRSNDRSQLIDFLTHRMD